MRRPSRGWTPIRTHYARHALLASLVLQLFVPQTLVTPCRAQTMPGAPPWLPPTPDPLAALANTMPRPPSGPPSGPPSAPPSGPPSDGASSAASGAASAATPASLCRAAIATAEAQTRIPEAFLAAIGRVESGNGPAGDAAWPWTINAGGSGHFYLTKAEAVAAARGFIAAGQRSLDVGCLQVNLQYHPDAFTSLEEAFDPAANASFAAKYLLGLFHQTGSWPQAAAAYHSFTPALGRAYQQKVLAAWASPDPRLPFRARDGAPPDPVLPEAAPRPCPGPCPGPCPAGRGGQHQPARCRSATSGRLQPHYQAGWADGATRRPRPQPGKLPRHAGQARSTQPTQKIALS